MRRIAHRFGSLNGVLCRLLWDSGCSDELVTPTFARQLIAKGATWEFTEEPIKVNHSDASVVGSGTPATMRICMDVLIVHKERVFQQDKVWFLVYDGCLSDAMLSETFLNEITCTSHPGERLMDTRARDGDLPLLLQQMDDYRALSQFRVNLAISSALTPPNAAPQVNNSTTSALSQALSPALTNTPAVPPPLPPEPSCSSQSPGDATTTHRQDPSHESARIKAALAEMESQRAQLMLRLGKPVSDEALSACMSVLDRYPENFRPPGHDPCKLGVYRIVLKDASKFHVALPRRVNAIMLAEIRRQVQELVAVGAIERCTSRPASIYALVMARRPNAPGKYRMCVDLVECNSNTVPAPYSIPDVQQALDRLSGKQLYCTFDFSSWFHQFELAEEDRDKVAFVVPGDNLTPPQIYRYKRVAFGLMNATYFCQRQLQEALELWPGCEGIYPFVDDIVLAANTLDDMLSKLDAFMQFCRHHNIRLKKEKTELATSAVRHVGFILSADGQHLDPARVESLINIGAPKNIEGLRSLLGSFGFVRGWLADMASTAAPLTDLMSGTAHRLKLDWGPAQDAALDALKLSVLLAPAKIAPDERLPFHIFVDASDVGVAAVLVQFRKNAAGDLVPFAVDHRSRRWSPREAAWQISEREMYAIRYGLFKFREYVQGHPDVSVHSDHLNLVTGLWKHSSPKIQRWRMFLESMRPFKLVHIGGTDPLQRPADALSRLHIRNLTMSTTAAELDPDTAHIMDRGEGEDDEPMFGPPIFCDAATQTAFISELTRHSATAAYMVTAISARERDLHNRYGIGFHITEKMGWSVLDHKICPLLASQTDRRGLGFRRPPTHAHSLLTSVPLYSEIDSVAHVADWLEEEEDRDHSHLVHCNLATSDSSQTSPQDYRDLAYKQAGGFPLADVMRRAHDDTHPGFLATWRRVIRAMGPRAGVNAAAIKAEVKRYCDACICCQKLQPAREKLLANIGTIRQHPFSSYAFDIVVLSDPDADGCRYILVCVDSFSRAVELFALRQANASSVTECLNDVLCRWGRVHELRCDNAKAFTSAVTTALLKRARVALHLTAPYSHQSNGQVENCNRRVMDILRAMVVDDRLGINTSSRWSLLLPDVRRVLMTRTIIQHGCTPNDLAYMNCPETESSIFAEESWMPRQPEHDEPCPGWISELARQHQALIDICDEKQEAVLQKLAELNERKAAASPLRKLQVHDFALLKLSDRPQRKIQPRWAGPYLVIGFPDNDPDHLMVELQHVATKKVGSFHLNMLKYCDMTLLKDVEDALPYASKDSFEYEIEEILSHQPTGPRKVDGKLRNKRDYEFRCLWKDLPLGLDNPSWEPYTNETLRSCEAYKNYVAQPHVVASLGANF